MLQNANAEPEPFKMCVMQHRRDPRFHPGGGNLHHLCPCCPVTMRLAGISVCGREWSRRVPRMSPACPQRAWAGGSGGASGSRSGGASRQPGMEPARTLCRDRTATCGLALPLPCPSSSSCHEQDVEVKLGLFPSPRSLIHLRHCRSYGDCAFSLPLVLQRCCGRMVGNPESLSNTGETHENSQAHPRASLWAALPGRCRSCSAAGNPEKPLCSPRAVGRDHPGPIHSSLCRARATSV